MKKNKKGGFALLETLIVTVFVTVIFSIIFLNFYPLIGEYERRENYNDVDSTYGAYWVKKMIEESRWKSGGSIDVNSADICYGGVYTPDTLGTLPFGINTNYYKSLLTKLDVNKFIITSYTISKLKSTGITNNNCKNTINSDSFIDYISYLPNYNYPSLNDGVNYRILVEFKHDGSSVPNSLKNDDVIDYPYYTYATLEVKK